jgi:hypothetical protein
MAMTPSPPVCIDAGWRADGAAKPTSTQREWDMVVGTQGAALDAAPFAPTDAAEPGAPPAPEEAPAPPPSADASAAAALAHGRELTPAEVKIAQKLWANPYAPIPLDPKSGRYEYEAALSHLSQKDRYQDTKYADCRCDENAIVAAMLMRGKDGFENCLAKLEKSLTSALVSPKPALKQAFQDLRAECRAAAKAAEKGTLSPHDLSHLADRMYAAFGIRDAAGNLTHQGTAFADQKLILNACGLGGLAKPETASKADYGDANLAKIAAEKLYKDLVPGQTCTVGVSGCEDGTEQHFVLVGKKPEPKPDGTPFVYDPAADFEHDKAANYLEGKDAIAHVKALACQCPNWTFGFPDAYFHTEGAAD